MRACGLCGSDPTNYNACWHGLAGFLLLLGVCCCQSRLQTQLYIHRSPHAVIVTIWCNASQYVWLLGVLGLYVWRSFVTEGATVSAKIGEAQGRRGCHHYGCLLFPRPLLIQSDTVSHTSARLVRLIFRVHRWWCCGASCPLRRMHACPMKHTEQGCVVLLRMPAFCIAMCIVACRGCIALPYK